MAHKVVSWMESLPSIAGEITRTGVEVIFLTGFILNGNIYRGRDDENCCGK